jgi:hypothetical protein
VNTNGRLTISRVNVNFDLHVTPTIQRSTFNVYKHLISSISESEAVLRQSRNADTMTHCDIDLIKATGRQTLGPWRLEKRVPLVREVASRIPRLHISDGRWSGLRPRGCLPLKKVSIIPEHLRSIPHGRRCPNCCSPLVPENQGAATWCTREMTAIWAGVNRVKLWNKEITLNLWVESDCCLNLQPEPGGDTYKKGRGVHMHCGTATVGGPSHAITWWTFLFNPQHYSVPIAMDCANFLYSTLMACKNIQFGLGLWTSPMQQYVFNSGC